MTFTDAAGKRWRVIHTDSARDVYTVVRARRFFAGSPALFTGLLVRALQDQEAAAAGLRVAQRAVVGR